MAVDRAWWRTCEATRRRPGRGEQVGLRLLRSLVAVEPPC